MKFTDADYDFQVQARNARIHLHRFRDAYAALLRILEGAR